MRGYRTRTGIPITTEHVGQGNVVPKRCHLRPFGVRHEDVFFGINCGRFGEGLACVVPPAHIQMATTTKAKYQLIGAVGDQPNRLVAKIARRYIHWFPNGKEAKGALCHECW